MVKNLPFNAGDPGSIPGSRRSPGEGNGNPLQCSFLENPTDRRAIHRVARVQHNLATKEREREVTTKSPWDRINLCKPENAVNTVVAISQAF